MAPHVMQQSELVAPGGLGPKGDGQTRNYSISGYHGQIIPHPNIPGVYMRHGEGVQHWWDGRVYAGQWEQHLYHGEGAIWHNESEYRAGLEGACYRGQWHRGKRHGHGVLRFLQEARQGKPREKVYAGQFRCDVLAGCGRLTAEPPPEGDASPQKEGKKVFRGGVPPPRIEVDQLLTFEGSFRINLEDTYDELDRLRPDWLEKHPFVQQEVRLENLTLQDRNSAGPMGDLFRRHFGDAPKGLLQERGEAMPDLAMAYYTLRGSDTNAISERGVMTFADDSIYEGDFHDGLPHGQGELVQRSRARSAQHPEEIARYKGQWRDGKRHGVGWYRTRRGIVYEGEWEHDHKNGEGVETVPAALEASFGYTRYEGQWTADRQDGRGMAFLGGTTARQGQAADGSPSMAAEEDDVPVYCGLWCRSAIQAPPEHPAWVHLVERGSTEGRFYFGPLLPDGSREGALGYLYTAAAASNAEFRAAVRRGEAYIEDASILQVLSGELSQVRAPEALRFTSYVGPWCADLPEGYGVQIFQPIGIYVGDFREGKRHGRGTWSVIGLELIYRPGAATGSNWEEDNMHGIFNVEEEGQVHEDIAYNCGVCRTWRPGLRQVRALAEVDCPASDYNDPAAIRSMSAVALDSARQLDRRRSRGQSMFRAA